MFQRRSLTHKLLVVNLFSIGTFGCLAPPPPIPKQLAALLLAHLAP